MKSREIVNSREDGICYVIERKDVKNINMHVNPNGEVIVSASWFIEKEKIDAFVTRKADWLRRQQCIALRNAQTVSVNLDEISLFGRMLKVKLSIGNENQISYDDRFLYVTHRSRKDPLILIHEFLDKLCHDVFQDVTRMTIHRMKSHALKMPQIKIRAMKSQWGNCRPDSACITLNNALIHYPFEFIEYVILHELTHFFVRNHSVEFYQIIEHYMPDYRKRISLIRELEAD